MFATKAQAKSKALTSGRLTGAVRANKANERGTSKSRPEATYSLHSEDAEEQVVTLHKGLDRCAALLSDILQCENSGAVPKDGETKSRNHTPTGKKAIRKSVSKSGAVARNVKMIRKKSSSKPTATTPQRSVLPHCGVSLHPSVRTPHLTKTSSKPQNSRVQPLCTALLPTDPAAAPDCAPERDQEPVSEAKGKMRRAQDLLGELKTLIPGHGNFAQTYLHLLEQTLSSALVPEATKTPSEQQETEELRVLQNHNDQLQRQVVVLQQQIQEQEATQQLLKTQVSSLQEQLSAVEEEMTQVQKTLQDTERRLQSGHEENIGIKAELESTRGRLKIALQERFKLEETLQKKRQEIEELRRIIDGFDLSSATADNLPTPGGAKERITQYLFSLQQSHPTHTLPDSLQALGTDQGRTNQGPEPDMESVISDWSVQSESSFNTRDEAAFRDGLAALDASIASLQKTLKLDLVKT